MALVAAIFAILVLFLWGGNGFGNRNGVGPVAADLGVTTAENAAETRAGLNYIGQSQAAQNNTLGQIKDNMSAGFAGVQQSLCQGFSGINTNLQNFDPEQQVRTCTGDRPLLLQYAAGHCRAGRCDGSQHLCDHQLRQGQHSGDPECALQPLAGAGHTQDHQSGV